MFDRFTENAQHVISQAQDQARTLKHNYLGTEHLLLGLVFVREGVGARVLENLGISLELVRQVVEERIGQGDHSTSGNIRFSPQAKKVLELSLREALRLRQLHRHRTHPPRSDARG